MNSNTPSAFSDWVFNQDNPNYIPEPRHKIDYLMRQGERDHKKIDEIRRRYSELIFDSSCEANWDVIYVDDGTDKEVLKASMLRHSGRVFKCKPDLVLAGKNNTYLVVERKTTTREEKEIPPEGWQNHLAQLWCYGHLDRFDKNDVVYLALEYYMKGASQKLLNDSYIYLPFEVLQKKLVGMKEMLVKQVSFMRGEEKYYLRIKKLFERYGGSVVF